jgi:1-deoxy-D-xylulose-5-phosphate synthase
LIVTLEENAIAGGFGAAVLELLAAHPEIQGGRIYNIGLPDRFVSQGTQKKLLEDLGLDGQGIARTISDLLRRNE